MECQQIFSFLENTPNQPTKFRTKNQAEINDDAGEKYSTNSQIKFKTSMIKLSLCDYSDAYILVSGPISVEDTSAVAAAANNTNKKVTFRKCIPFTAKAK